MTKTRTGENGNTRDTAPKAYANEDNVDRCIVELYMEYVRHRPLDTLEPDSPFYLAVNTRMTDNPRSWYKRAPLGIHSLGSTMKDMAVEAGLEGNFTNHSVRKTLCTNLLQAGVAPTLIQQISGHKNVASISSYASASKAQVKKMNEILNNPVENVPKYGEMSSVKTDPAATEILEKKAQTNVPQDVKKCQDDAKAAMGGLMQHSVLNNCTMNFTFNVQKSDEK